MRENLVRASNQNATGLFDKEIIDQAAEVGSNVILRHRKEIKALHSVIGSVIILYQLPRQQ